MPPFSSISRDSGWPSGAMASVLSGAGTVLLVEDEEFIAELLTTLFARAGIKVLHAGDGAGALRIMAEHGAAVRLAMIDFGLPDITGDVLGERLRELAPGLPVMLTSGREMDDSRLKLAGSGPTWFMAKPYRTAQLVDQVRALLVTAA